MLRVGKRGLCVPEQRSRSETAMVAYALEMDEKLLPFASELLADLDELGGDAEWIVELLASLELPSTTRVLDLGCGKGAVAVEIADELAWRVDGIDLHAPFIAACEEAALVTGVSCLCTFAVGDILALSRSVSDAVAGPGAVPGCDRYDVVVMAALGDVLGSWSATIAALRRFVVPGGFIAINDVVLREGGSSDFEGFADYLTRDAMIEQLESCGDRVVRAVIDQPDQPDQPGQPGQPDQPDQSDQSDQSAQSAQSAQRGACDEYVKHDRPDKHDQAGSAPIGSTENEPDHFEENRLIRHRAEALAVEYPGLATELLAFAAGQEAECAYLHENVSDVLWLLERGRD